MQEAEKPTYSSVEHFEQEMARQAGMTPEQLEKYQVVLDASKEFKKESDRGCCLMAASFLEHELQELIKSKLVGSKKFHETLFEFNGPLGTFSSKIKLAFAIGMISSQVLNDLEIIRKIRNDFGHKHQPINFNTNDLKSRINNLQNSLYEKGQATPRAIFINTVLGILGRLHGSSASIKKFEERSNSPVSSSRKQELMSEAVRVASELREAANKQQPSKDS